VGRDLAHGKRQQLLHRPDMVGKAGRHSGRAGCKAARGLGTATRQRRVEFEPQGSLRTAEMIREAGAPPFELGDEFASELGRGPGATG